jgi:hypothetical protein
MQRTKPQRDRPETMQPIQLKLVVQMHRPLQIQKKIPILL